MPPTLEYNEEAHGGVGCGLWICYVLWGWLLKVFQHYGVRPSCQGCYQEYS